MPYTFAVDTTLPLVHVYGVGALNLDDIRDLSDAIAAAGVYAVPRLVDMRDATLHLSAAQVQSYVHVLAEYRAAHGAVRIAIVVRDPATFGILRMYQILSSEQNPGFGVFYGLSEAMDWLQLDAASPIIAR